MNDFKNYNPENDDKREQTESGKAPNSAELNSTVELAKAVTKAMNGKSEGQLLHTIIAEAERGKRAGTLTNEELDNFYNMLSPMVDGVKRKKLKEVIARLKSI